MLWWLLECCLQFLEQSWSYVVLFCPSYVTDIDVGNQNIPLYPIQSHHCDHLMFGIQTVYCHVYRQLCSIFFLHISQEPCQSLLITVRSVDCRRLDNDTARYALVQCRINAWYSSISCEAGGLWSLLIHRVLQIPCKGAWIQVAVEMDDYDKWVDGSKGDTLIRPICDAINNASPRL